MQLAKLRIGFVVGCVFLLEAAGVKAVFCCESPNSKLDLSSTVSISVMKNHRIHSVSTLRLLLPLTAFALVASCAVAQDAAPEKAAPVANSNTTPDKIISDAGNGATATLKKGQRLLVKLGSNPTTGYEWSVAKTDDKLLPTDGETEFDVPTTQMAGAPTVQTLFFKAKAVGKVVLNLQYTRPWEEDVAPAKVYKVTLNIVE